MPLTLSTTDLAPPRARDERFLGGGLEPEQIWPLAAQVFGSNAMPPFHD